MKDKMEYIHTKGGGRRTPEGRKQGKNPKKKKRPQLALSTYS